MGKYESSYETTQKLLKKRPEMAQKLENLLRIVKESGVFVDEDLELCGFTPLEIKLLKKHQIIKKVFEEMY